MIKIDPYLNVDAGTMSPFEHGNISPPPPSPPPISLGLTLPPCPHLPIQAVVLLFILLMACAHQVRLLCSTTEGRRTWTWATMSVS